MCECDERRIAPAPAIPRFGHKIYTYLGGGGAATSSTQEREQRLLRHGLYTVRARISPAGERDDTVSSNRHSAQWPPPQIQKNNASTINQRADGSQPYEQYEQRGDYLLLVSVLYQLLVPDHLRYAGGRRRE